MKYVKWASVWSTQGPKEGSSMKRFLHSHGSSHLLLYFSYIKL